MREGAAEHAEHFESAAQQAHAARLGMWVFLASELLLFAGLIALYFGYRAEHARAFALGAEHNPRLLGSLNTAILLTSSFAVALAVHALRGARRGRAVLLVLGAIALGGVFLVIKFAEYGLHFDEGIHPGGAGRFFAAHPEPGLPVFYTLYFVTTGLHAAHVVVGMCVLGFGALTAARARLAPEHAAHRLEVCAMYWHVVDAIWIFLWPMFYLMGGARA